MENSWAQEAEQHIPESAPEPRSTNSQMKSKSPRASPLHVADLARDLIKILDQKSFAAAFSASRHGVTYISRTDHRICLI
jgi:hypothetical protein